MGHARKVGAVDRRRRGRRQRWRGYRCVRRDVGASAGALVRKLRHGLCLRGLLVSLATRLWHAGVKDPVNEPVRKRRWLTARPTEIPASLGCPQWCTGKIAEG